MRRREFITLLGGGAFAWPLAARAQQTVTPVVGFIRDGSGDASTRYVAAFRKGLGETGYVEGQNVTVEYHWLEGQQDRLPALLAGLIRRQVAVFATPGNVPTPAAKAATVTILSHCNQAPPLASRGDLDAIRNEREHRPCAME